MATASSSDLPALPMDVRLMNGIAAALFALVACGLLAAALMWAVRSPAFAFRAVRLEGELSRNSVNTIRANAMPKLRGNFFTMDLEKTRQAFEEVPWVQRAIVRRIWPNVLRVQLIEHRAAAIWQEADGSEKLVDADGEVFEANVGDVEDDGLPTFRGPEGSAPRVLAMYQQLKPGFERLDMVPDTVTLSGRGSWHAELDTGAEVELGRGEEAEVLARTERFLRTVTQVTGRFDNRPLAYADLRHVDGYAVKLKGITTTAEPPQGGHPPRGAAAQRPGGATNTLPPAAGAAKARN